MDHLQLMLAFWFNSFTYLTNFIQVGHDDGQKFFSNALNMINDVLNLNLYDFTHFFYTSKMGFTSTNLPNVLFATSGKNFNFIFFIISLLTIFLTSWFEIALWWTKTENTTNHRWLVVFSDGHPIDYQKPKGINRSCTLLQLTYRNRKTSY